MCARILFVVRSLDLGGAERQLVTLARAQAEQGQQVAVALFYPGGTLDAELGDIPVYSLAKRGRWDLIGPFSKLVRALRDWRPDIVHGYLPVANLLAFTACALVPGPRVVFGIRASDMDMGCYDAVSRWTYRLEALVAGRADLVIANSAAGLTALRQRGAEHRGVVIANGIDTQRFRPDPAARAEWRQRLGVDDTTLLIGMAARRDPMKDHDTFFAAARQMAERHRNIAFTLAGNGTQSLSAELGAPLHVVGPLAQVERWMAALDVGVLASRFGEGFPNALAEMMACGVPCVATDVGDSALVAQRVVPAGDASALAQACLDLATSPTEGRARIEQHFSVAALTAKTLAVLQALERPLVVHLITGLGSGGAEHMLARLVQSSKAFRHVVISLTGGGKFAEKLRRDGIEVVTLDLPAGPRALLALPRLIRLLRRLRPALIQTWLYHADLLGTLAAFFSDCRRLIWSLRCSNMDKARYGRLVGLLARLSRRPQVVISNSQAGIDWHKAQGYAPRAWALIDNDVDTARFHPDPAARAAWRLRLGIAPSTMLVGMAARRDPMKDHDAFLAAAKLARPDFTFVMAGHGTEDMPGGLGQVEDMAGFYAALDVFVSASRFGEGFPNVVAEAMSSGLACVVTDIGDAKRLVGEAGLVVPSGDVAALASAIAQAASRRDELGIAARRRMEAEFASPGSVTRHEMLWASLLGKRGD